MTPELHSKRILKTTELCGNGRYLHPLMSSHEGTAQVPGGEAGRVPRTSVSCVPCYPEGPLTAQRNHCLGAGSLCLGPLLSPHFPGSAHPEMNNYACGGPRSWEQQAAGNPLHFYSYLRKSFSSLRFRTTAEVKSLEATGVCLLPPGSSGLSPSGVISSAEITARTNLSPDNCRWEP